MKQMMRVAAMGIAGVMVLSAAAAVPYVESDGTQAIDTGYYRTPTRRSRWTSSTRSSFTSRA